jgi:hypothetical protein
MMQTSLKSAQLFPNVIPCELLALQMVHKHKFSLSLAFTELNYLIITIMTIPIERLTLSHHFYCNPRSYHLQRNLNKLKEKTLVWKSIKFLPSVVHTSRDSKEQKQQRV